MVPAIHSSAPGQMGSVSVFWYVADDANAAHGRFEMWTQNDKIEHFCSSPITRNHCDLKMAWAEAESNGSLTCHLLSSVGLHSHLGEVHLLMEECDSI